MLTSSEHPCTRKADLCRSGRRGTKGQPGPTGWRASWPSCILQVLLWHYPAEQWGSLKEGSSFTAAEWQVNLQSAWRPWFIPWSSKHRSRPARVLGPHHSKCCPWTSGSENTLRLVRHLSSHEPACPGPWKPHPHSSRIHQGLIPILKFDNGSLRRHPFITDFRLCWNLDLNVPDSDSTFTGKAKGIWEPL